MKAESVSLYFQEGVSDKVYLANLEEKDGKFLVNFSYGRRGSTLQTGTKTKVPVDYEAAKKIYDKLVKSKTSKGYQEGKESTSYQHTDQDQSKTNIHCQLLNPIEEFEAKKLIKDKAYCLQEKHDGVRMLIRKQKGEVMGVNRRGLTAGLPVSIVEAAKALPGDFILDGEAVGDFHYTFDLLSIEGKDTKELAYRKRLETLKKLFDTQSDEHIQLVETALTTEEKSALMESLQKSGKEGVVFKRLSGFYTAGRPNSGGTQLKFKFYETISAMVSKVNAKRSVGLKLLDGDEWVSAGNVTIPANYPIPDVDDFVEIRYLYARKESGALYQPTYLGKRADIVPEECLTSQLKYKDTP